MNPADEAWVQRLFEENAPLIYQVAVRRLGDEEGAENIVQEAFWALVEKLDAVRTHPNPSGWLLKAAQYLILQAIRESGKQNACETPLDKSVQQISIPFSYAPPLGEVLPAGLTRRERQLLIWRYEEELPYAEIASRLKIPIMTCRTQMFRARCRCKTLWAQEDPL